MNNKMITIAIAAVALLAAPFTIAATAKDKGVYIGGSVGYGKVYETVKGDPKKDNHGVVLGANAGYKFNKNFAIETGLERYSNAKFSGGVTAKDNYIIHLAAKGILPMKNGFSVYGKAGPALAHSKFVVPGVGFTKHTETVFYGALGTSYAISNNVEINLEGSATSKSKNLPGMASIMSGLTYNF